MTVYKELSFRLAIYLRQKETDIMLTLLKALTHPFSKAIS